MLWEYVYIGSEIVRSSLVGLCHPLLTMDTREDLRRSPAPTWMAQKRNRKAKAGQGTNKNEMRLPVNQQGAGLEMLLALEPRIMFDGAALLTGAEVIQDQSTQHQDLAGIDPTVLPETDSNPFTKHIDISTAISPVTAPSDRREIVFLDTSVEDYETLLLGIDPHAEAVLLDSTRDGIQHIAEILGDRTDIDAIHIISHGNQAELKLGTGYLTLASINGQYADELAIIGQALTDNADVLIYGCNFGEGQAGKAAAARLAQLTGADIASSEDLTGMTGLGGDWELEVNTGTIETAVAVNAQAQETWQGLLIPLVDTGEFTANNASGNDEETSGRTRGSDRAVDIASNGDYVVVWTDETTSNSVHAKVFDKDGNEKVSEFQVNIGGTNNQWANVAMDDSGNFIVAWTQLDEVFMRRFQADGTAIDAGDVQVNTLTTNFQQNPSVSMNGGGDFVIAWETEVGGNAGIFVRRGTFAGGLIGSDITVDAGAGRANASVDINDAGKFVVAWQQGNEPHAQRFDASGMPRGPAIDINPFASSLEQHPVVAVQSSGDFVVAYRSEIGGFQGVWMKRYHDDGSAYGIASKVSSGNSHLAPSISVDSSDNYIIVYEGDGDGSGKGVFGRKYDSGGTAQGAQFQINETTLNGQDRASVAMSDLNNFVAVWTGSDGSQTDVFARQFGTITNTDPSITSNGGLATAAINAAENQTTVTTVIAIDTDLPADTLTFSKNGGADAALFNLDSVTGVLTFTSARDFETVMDNNSDGVYEVTVQVDDGNGGVDTQDISVTVTNVSPTILTTTGSASVASGVSYTLNLSANEDVTSWTINWGDGTIDTIPGNPPSATHTYANSGFTFNILASATDVDGTHTSSDLLLSSNISNTLFRFDATDGSLKQEFANGSGLVNPVDIDIGPDGLIYATSFGSNDIRRYDTSTGTFIDVFVLAGSGGLNAPSRIAWGPDGNLYVTSLSTNEVLRFDGTTGGFIDDFVTAGSGGLDQPDGIAFGNDGNLYVASDMNGKIFRYNGLTGAFVDEFADFGSTGFTDISFGPDGHLYVSNVSANTVQRFDGTTGAYIDDFVTAASGGLDGAAGLMFGPGGNLHVVAFNGDNVYRYDGGTGAFIDVLVPSGSGQDAPVNLAFTPAHQVMVSSNTPPTLDLDSNDDSGATGNDYQFVFTENDGPTAIADMDTDLVDADSIAFDHVTLSVSGLLDGNAETLVLDGSTFDLATVEGGRDTAGANYHVVIGTGSGNATVAITKQSGGTFSEAETETLITAIQYQHTDTNNPTDGNRLIDVIVNDGTNDSVAARTTINVNPANDQPSFTGLDNAPIFTEGGTGVVLDTNATISDPELDAVDNYNGAILTLIRNGGANANDVFNGGGTLNPLAETGNLVVGTTTIGSVTTNSAGTLVLTFNNNATTALVNSTLQQITYRNTNSMPPANVQIDFTINDGNAGSQGSGGARNAMGSITVTISPNTPPVAVADAFVVNEGSSATLNLTGNDTDADDGLDLTSITIVSGPTNGTINNINTDGTVSYTHNGSETLLDSFTYTIDDLTGDTSNTVTVSVTITPQNDPPMAVNNSFTVDESSTNTLNLAGNDTDADDGLDLTSIVIVSGPTNGTITSIHTNGTVDYTHNGSETVADSFTYTMNDVAGATSNTATVNLTITPQNDAPIITSDGGGTSANVRIITDNTRVTGVTATDAESTPVTYSITDGADAALFTIDSLTGALTFITAPNIQTPGDVGGDNVYDVIVQASDGVLTDTQAIAITVVDLPFVVLPPTTDPQTEAPSESGDEDTGESEDELTGNLLNAVNNTHGYGSSGNQSSTSDAAKDSNMINHLTKDTVPLIQHLRSGNGSQGGATDELMNLLQSAFGTTPLKSKMESLLGASSGFLNDLDQARDALNDIMATEKTYVASSIAASTGLSVGYVFWLLRSGVLLTALLSSVPAWQFVNPLLVLDTPTKKKHLKGPKDLEDDSVESMFENHSEPSQASPSKTKKDSKSH